MEDGSQKKIIIVLCVIFIIGLIAIPFFDFLSGYFRAKAEKEKIVAYSCKTDFSRPAKEINYSRQYIEPWYGQGQTFFNPLDKLSFLRQQYDACQLFLGSGDIASSFSLIDSADRDQTIVLFKASQAVNDIFSADCGSSKSEEAVKILKSNRPDHFGQVDALRLCQLMKAGGSDQDYKNLCGANEQCFLAIKADPGLIDDNPIFADFAGYLTALRKGDSSLCPRGGFKTYLHQESFPRIPCQAYFMKKGTPYCDKIYNEIKNFCNEKSS